MAAIAKKDQYTISELAGEFDISTRSIRFYEEKELISPGRTKGNHRIYTKRDRQRLKMVLRGKRFNYSLEEIAEIIGLYDVDTDETDRLEKSLEYGEKKLSDIKERINDLKLLEQDFISLGKKISARLMKLEKEKNA